MHSYLTRSSRTPIRIFYPKIPQERACPCRSESFSSFVVAGQFGPAMLAYPKIAHNVLLFRAIFMLGCGFDLKKLGPAMLVYPKTTQSAGGYAAPQSGAARDSGSSTGLVTSALRCRVNQVCFIFITRSLRFLTQPCRFFRKTNLQIFF